VLHFHLNVSAPPDRHQYGTEAVEIRLPPRAAPISSTQAPPAHSCLPTRRIPPGHITLPNPSRIDYAAPRGKNAQNVFLDLPRCRPSPSRASAQRQGKLLHPLRLLSSVSHTRHQRFVLGVIVVPSNAPRGANTSVVAARLRGTSRARCRIRRLSAACARTRCVHARGMQRMRQTARMMISRSPMSQSIRACLLPAISMIVGTRDRISPMLYASAPRTPPTSLDAFALLPTLFLQCACRTPGRRWPSAQQRGRRKTTIVRPADAGRSAQAPGARRIAGAVTDHLWPVIRITPPSPHSPLPSRFGVGCVGTHVPSRPLLYCHSHADRAPVCPRSGRAQGP